ncbi:MAG: rRNA maturation RNase YbeY [Elusimicrobiota bacterium]|jgi:probable rRNA maturation factor|nr:rRNA maturation RNase YbeY [Elusimicrobiota bacterium]
MQINVFYKTKLPKYYRVSGKYKAVVSAALGKLARRRGEVNLIVLNPKEMRALNKKFLGHDYVTDAISFNYPFDGGAFAPFGDVFICHGQAKKQARNGALFEMLTLAAHGALHLAGWQDDTLKKRTAMNNMAEKLVRKVLKN